MTPVSVDELTTEVVPEREPPATAAAALPSPPWVEAERQRAVHERLERDACRTRIEGYGG
jgi:hypothetical protein